MNHQKDDHLRLAQAKPIRLTLSRVRRDDDIAQELRVEGHELSLPHGESKDIGRFVAAEEALVQLPNLAVVDEGNADLYIREGQVGQDRFSHSS